MCLSTNVISHRQLASARISCDNCYDQGHDKRDTLSIKTYLANLNEFGDFRHSNTIIANKKELKYDHAHLFIYCKYIAKMIDIKHRRTGLHNDSVFMVNTVRNLSNLIR